MKAQLLTIKTWLLGSALAVACLIPFGVAKAHGENTEPRFLKGSIHYPEAPKEDDFKAALSIVLHRMLTSYASEVKEPLSIYVMDTNVPSVRQFFESSSSKRGGRFDPHTVLGLSYDGYAKINGKRTAACMVQYNSHRRMELLAGYERSGVFTKQEIVYYLASHEFGHCIAFHQAQLGNGPILNPKEHELMADKVSVAFFYVNGSETSAERVLKFNRTLVDDHLHSHPGQLLRWYENLKTHLDEKDVRSEVKSMADLYRLALTIPHS